MFADGTNLFLSDHSVDMLFKTSNQELQNIVDWFRAHKLSLNANKTKHTLSYKTRSTNNIPITFQLMELRIDGVEITKVSSIKFLGVIFDEKITWKEHIRTLEKKIAKNIGLMYKDKHLLDSDSLKNIYFSYDHSYLNYANITWGSIHVTKLKKLFSQQ